MINYKKEEVGGVHNICNFVMHVNEINNCITIHLFVNHFSATLEALRQYVGNTICAILM